MKRNHREELNQKCCYCGKKLSSNKKLLEHIRIVHFDIRKFPCPICNHRFTAKRDVHKHINSAHSRNGQKIETSQNSNDINNFQPVVEMNPNQKRQKLKTPVSCEICNKKFGYLGNLKRHLKRGACLEKPVNQNVQFATAKPVPEIPSPTPAQQVTNVEIPVHERKKKNSCEFEKVSAVKCKVCNDLFIELSDLKRHHNLVHEENEPLKDVEDYLKF